MKRAYKFAIPIAALIAQGFDEPADAAIYLKVEGIDGESTAPGHEAEIDVLAWSWGVSNGGLVFGGGGSTKSSFTPIKVIKSVDAATANLVASAAIGQHINTAVLTMTRPAQGGGEFEFMKITLTQLIVSKVAHGGKDSEAGIAETITLDYTTIKIEYQQEVKGSGWEEVCWDREQLKSC